MLHFFRTYQKYFFLMITIVIVISFSFFGTYSAMGSNDYVDNVAFTAVDGTPVYASEVEQMAQFIATDAQDKLLYGGVWGPNFLNDGVIFKNVMQTGLAGVIAQSYKDVVQEELFERLAREKSFVPYVHPNAQFISTVNSWNYFAPQMRDPFRALRQTTDPTNPESFGNRVALYLGEKQFPAPALRQVLKYQQQQYNWIAPDPDLDRIDLSLFGYHTIEDWFGPRFLRLVSQVIINGAKIAEQKGYQVSKAEALADLARNAALSYQQNAKNPNLGVANSSQYLNEQLRRMRMDQNTAAHLWQQVLLFRKMMDDTGSAPIVDATTFANVSDYNQENAEVDVYQLPEELRFNEGRQMLKFESYLDAISKNRSGTALPTEFKSVGEVAGDYPELVQKRFLLNVAEVTKNQLLTKVSVKETWNWEVQDDHWNELQQKFPELGAKTAATRNERFTALDSLDDKTRAAVDRYAREQIVNAHPEWINEALQTAVPQTISTGISLQGGKIPFHGVTDRAALFKLLEATSLGDASDPAAQEAQAKLNNFTEDNEHYYKIQVVDRSPRPEVQTFAEANASGTIDEIADRKLNEHYLAVREKKPKLYKKEDGSWKTFSDVSNSLIGSYLSKSLENIGSDYAEDMTPPAIDKDLPVDKAATLRFYKHISNVQKQIQQNPETEQQYIAADSSAADPGHLPERTSLAEQWKLVKQHTSVTRSDEAPQVDVQKALNMQENEWSPVNVPADGNIHFFKVTKKGSGKELIGAKSQVEKAYTLLAAEAQQALMRDLLQVFINKEAISLAYLDSNKKNGDDDTE